MDQRVNKMQGLDTGRGSEDLGLGSRLVSGERSRSFLVHLLGNNPLDLPWQHLRLLWVGR